MHGAKVKIWYWYYAIGDYPILIILNVLQLVLTTWWTKELMSKDRQ
jgi:hypothetical protein